VVYPRLDAYVAVQQQRGMGQAGKCGALKRNGLKLVRAALLLPTRTALTFFSRSSSKTAAPSPTLPTTLSSEPSANGNALLPASAAGLISSQGGEIELYIGGSSSMMQTEPSNPSGVNLNLLSDRSTGHVRDVCSACMSHHICICMHPAHGLLHETLDQICMCVYPYICPVVIDAFKKCANARRTRHSLATAYPRSIRHQCSP